MRFRSRMVLWERMGDGDVFEEQDAAQVSRRLQAGSQGKCPVSAEGPFRRQGLHYEVDLLWDQDDT